MFNKSGCSNKSQTWKRRKRISGGFKLISCTAAGDKFLFPRLNVPARIEITVCFPRLKSQRAVREVGNQAQNVQATCLSCTKTRPHAMQQKTVFTNSQMSKITSKYRRTLFQASNAN